jgi:hypothetical protein
MVLGFGQTKGDHLATLIAKKQYAKAIEVLKARLRTGRPDDRLRLQLADVLVLAGKGKEAVMILVPLADGYAREGFAAKAISVLKKIQRIDPGHREVESKLAALIEEKQRHATVTLPPGGFEIGMEEIGFEPLMASADLPLAESQPDMLEATPSIVEADPLEVTPEVIPAPVEDRDLFAGDAGEILLEPDPEPDVHAMSEAHFGDELMALVDGAFGDLSRPDQGDTSPSAPSQIVVSPLFKDFSVDELVAVIHGLNLLIYEAGDIILTEGEPGDSLYMLTSGSVKALKKDPSGRQTVLGQLAEGAFFGEGSILTGRQRSATVVAVTRCELLELDRSTLDSIVSTHPHVWEILQQFATERAAKG